LGKLVDQIPGKQIKFECGLLGCSAEPLLLVNKVNQTHQLKKISEEKQSNTGSAVSSDNSSAKSICSTPDNQDSTSQEEQIISHTPSSPTKSILPVDSPATDKSDDPSVTYSRATSSKISSEEYGATSDAQSSSSHSNSNEHKRIPTVPEQYDISLTAKDWNSIKPKTGCFHLSKNWSDKLRDACKKNNPYCVLITESHQNRHSQEQCPILSWQSCVQVQRVCYLSFQDKSRF
jgi:hypothetical protein